MDYLEEYGKWLSCPHFSAEAKEELKNINDEKEIEDRFYKHLSFGTGGLRGVIGYGNNRINEYTVGRATKGLCNYLKKTGGKSVVIAYDSRIKSDTFAKRAALVFAQNGIKAYLFESLRPTPELSFAVVYCKADAGVVITASHNPPEYNGYKVYNRFGGQIVPPEDKLIIDEV
ncbi:MAG: phospho-sugar mutase, partial [Clostridia bacterium]|nr:phospho-sugar mutase [Clostridia bacterium]